MDDIDTIVQKHVSRNRHRTYGFAHVFDHPFGFRDGLICFSHGPSNEFYDCLSASLDVAEELREHGHDVQIEKGDDELGFFPNGHVYVRVSDEVYDVTGLYRVRGACHTRRERLSIDELQREHGEHVHTIRSGEMIPIREQTDSQGTRISFISITYQEVPHFTKLRHPLRSALQEATVTYTVKRPGSESSVTYRIGDAKDISSLILERHGRCHQDLERDKQVVRQVIGKVWELKKQV